MATRVPEPHQTPDGPAYQGRLLVRPDEEVVDQGAGFDVGTLLSRRAVLSLIGIGVGATALAACSSLSGRGSAVTQASLAASSEPSGSSGSLTSSALPASVSPGSTVSAASSAASSAGSATGTETAGLPSGEIPDETAGPYPGDGSNGPDVLATSGIVRRDIRTSIGSTDVVDGVPLTFTFTITDMANGDAPFQNVAVYAWHCDSQGRYSLYSDGVEDESFLRGVQVTDAKGQVSYTSIVPGCYSGRWPHIHFEVYPDIASITDSANVIATSQLAFPEAVVADVYQLSTYPDSSSNLSRVTLASDNVFGNDSAALQMATMSGSTTSGYVASLAVRVDTRTAPAPSPGGGDGGGGRSGAPTS